MISRHDFLNCIAVKVIEQAMIITRRVFDGASNQSRLGSELDRLSDNFGRIANPSSKSAETGKSVASTIVRTCASASSRVSSHLSAKAQPDAALDAANALNPSPVSIRAEPTSQGFGMTNAPSRHEAHESWWLFHVGLRP
jgi:hypothetical protein